MDEKQFIRNFRAIGNGVIDVFLGAGASLSSGIATGNDFVWYFKREIYCAENEVNKEKFKDLKSEKNRSILQKYFDAQTGYPKRGSPDEYSYYFEKCYSTRDARKGFMEAQVAQKHPSIGYLCLANLVMNSIVNTIWTTNFDELMEAAIKKIDEIWPLNVLSSANQNAFGNINEKYSCICKLHGDYRYDKLQNTSAELQSLEGVIAKRLKEKLHNKGLLVIGYSGSDDSVMKVLEENVSNVDFLSKGLYWTILKGSAISNRVKRLIDGLNREGKPADVIEIDGFDEFFANIYYSMDNRIELIDKLLTLKNENKKLKFSLERKSEFIKLNAFVAKDYPLCNVFATDIKDWKTLRQYRGDLIAGLFNGHIYSFAIQEELERKFNGHITSEITNQEMPQTILKRDDSVYTGMLYDLIGKVLQKKGLIQYRKSKFYNPETKEREDSYWVYEAVDICLEFIDGKYYLLISPTFHFTSLDGSELDRFKYKINVNRKSNLYNAVYKDKLYKWQKILMTDKKLAFEDQGYSIEFSSPAISCGGTTRDPRWEEREAFQCEEPVILFSIDDKSKATINQLKGLVKYGPIDCSYSKNLQTRAPIKLGLIVPDLSLTRLLVHLRLLNERENNNGKDKFLPDYPGFKNAFKCGLIVPDEDDSKRCCVYDQMEASCLSEQEFFNRLKSAINRFELNRSDFDVLIVYIPNVFNKFRKSESISPDFDLHDALKLYATDRNITLQFIEERSVSSKEKCKVLWGLSTAIYAKSAMGALWHPQTIDESTAYVGISYAISKKEGICIGCSQLFDSTGTGMRMLLRKIEFPKFTDHHRKNPYMGQEEARNMMLALREEYYRCNPATKLDRIVIHKTTPFMKAEILGILQAFEGVTDIELIQIREFSRWKGIKFGLDYTKVDNYPVDRGMVIPISDDSCLLWTHGVVQHSDLGIGHYYKNGRGIPSPVVVRRFYGNCPGEVLIREILMLTKMNWNSGDCLYKLLPVTLDFAKVLSRMSKQDEALYNKAYDFRYFM